jgi:uncharacterized protein YprB with RNaseH-like and TPR domain
VLGGEWRESGGLRCFVVERSFDGRAVYGRARVADCAGAIARGATKAAAMLAGAPAGPPFLFFDLETTGLSGGAGTCVFLVGFGLFEADTFITKQYLLAAHGDERPMLHLVAAELARAGSLVSFNGRSFDLPILETRYLFHRLECAIRSLPHIDVLHPARRFWGGARAGAADASEPCSLVALEEHVLAARRTGDVPGFEIPARYFQFVRSGNARPLAAVLEHNRLDLLALAALCGRLVHLVSAGPSAAATAQEVVALGRLYMRGGMVDDARSAFERALAMAGNEVGAAALRVESLRALAVAGRRAGRHVDAADRWRQLLATPGCPATFASEATEALAIHHEHRVRDLPAARAFALEGLTVSARASVAQRARHRLARLERKIAADRAQEAPLFQA